LRSAARKKWLLAQLALMVSNLERSHRSALHFLLAHYPGEGKAVCGSVGMLLTVHVSQIVSVAVFGTQDGAG